MTEKNGYSVQGSHVATVKDTALGKRLETGAYTLNLLGGKVKIDLVVKVRVVTVNPSNSLTTLQL